MKYCMMFFIKNSERCIAKLEWESNQNIVIPRIGDKVVLTDISMDNYNELASDFDYFDVKSVQINYGDLKGLTVIEVNVTGNFYESED